MKQLLGKVGNPGVAIGQVLFLSADTNIRMETISDIESENRKLDEAINAVKSRLFQTAEKSDEKAAEILKAQAMILVDKTFTEKIRRIIRNECVCAEYAAVMAGEEMATEFEAMNNDYLQSRGEDFRDMAMKIANAVTGRQSAENLTAPSILIAEELSPEELSSMNRELVLGVATKRGAATSHTAILCGNYGIPYLFGVDFEKTELEETAFAAIRTDTSTLFLSPDAKIREEIEKILLRQKQEEQSTVQTVDGIQICANIGGPEDLEAVRQCGADGIGLFRTEFLFMNRDTLPEEEEQFQVYKTVLEGMNGCKVVIRTLDIGADKKTACLDLPEEDNPALGRRAIRICLEKPELFRTQLRALLRAACFGEEAIMYPMIASVQEIEDIREQINIAASELEKRKAPYRIPKQGIMIETPSAALLSDRFAEKVDFFSIGTNDLTQYTLAVDRTAHGLDRFYDPMHESVMRLIEMTVKNAHAKGIPVGICGELGGNEKAIPKLMEMGVDELSMSPLKVKKAKAVASREDRKSAAWSSKKDSLMEQLASPADGILIPMEKIPDPTFSKGMLGTCIAVEPENGIIYAPCSGTVTMIADTNHAIGIISDFGNDILIHVGINTVSLNGKGFRIRTAADSRIETGDILMEVDLNIIRNAGLSAMVIMAVKGKQDER